MDVCNDVDDDAYGGDEDWVCARVSDGGTEGNPDSGAGTYLSSAGCMSQSFRAMKALALY